MLKDHDNVLGTTYDVLAEDLMKMVQTIILYYIRFY